MIQNQEFTRDPADLTIENLAPNRPTIGNDIPVVLWRLIRVVGLHKILEEETAVTIYFVGKHIGRMLKVKNIEELIAKLTELKIGKMDTPVNSEEHIHISFSECLTCSGINPPLGKPICQLEAGMVIGALENIYPDKKIIGEETKCMGGLGDDVCLIECKIV